MLALFGGHVLATVTTTLAMAEQCWRGAGAIFDDGLLWERTVKSTDTPRDRKQLGLLAGQWDCYLLDHVDGQYMAMWALSFLPLLFSYFRYRCVGLPWLRTFARALSSERIVSGP